MMALVAQKVIRPSQTAFLPGRNKMEGVVVLYETLHKLHGKKRAGLFLGLISKRPMTRSIGYFYV